MAVQPLSTRTTLPAGLADAPPARKRRLSPNERRNLVKGLLFVSPWVVGFLLFIVYPFAYTIRMSFMRYSGFGEMEFVGLDNYRYMLEDDWFWTALYNTFFYTGLAVPIGAVVAMVLALSMNQKVREVTLYRTLLYIPSVIPVFALSFIFLNLVNPNTGIFNEILMFFGLPNINWFGDPRYGKIAFVILAQFGAGQVALIFLAGLKGIPQHLYEAASIDGAGPLRKFWNITLPMMTPVILYDLILGLSLGIQIFTQVVILTSPAGSPANSNLMYVVYLRDNMFEYSNMGYASALAWVLFLITMVLAAIIFRWSRNWVHYESS